MVRTSHNNNSVKMLNNTVLLKYKDISIAVKLLTTKEVSKTTVKYNTIHHSSTSPVLASVTRSGHTGSSQSY